MKDIFLSQFIKAIESVMPAGTKRRRFINSIGRPLAESIGIINKEAPLGSVGAGPAEFDKLIKAAEEAGGGYWDSIVNLLRIKTRLFLSAPENIIEFPSYDRPEVTILIVTFNKAEYTLQCLETIKAHTDIPYEIVIVDNASSDETGELLERLRNVTVVKNNANEGFLKACNRGSACATGEYILFLNNDIQAGPGWLSKLVSTIKTYPRCGAVGAKLVLPGGRLQEAGSIIWRDGAALGYGRGANPFSPEYNYLKEVDYCSGACLLVRKDLFERLGRFDERYSPAYYEEADLCMGIRELGYKVVYQPEVQFIHYEFGSSSRKSAGAQAIQNRKKFEEKWKGRLSGHLANTKDSVFSARDKRPGKRLLVIDDRVPAPYLGYGYPRTYELLKYLSELGYVVSFLPLHRPEPAQPHTSYLQQTGIEVLYGDKKPDFEKFLSPRKDLYDAVIVSRPHNAWETLKSIKTLAPRAKVIYDAEAVFALREIVKSRLSGVEVSEEKKKELVSGELEITRYADAVITVSEYEKKAFTENGMKNVEVWGHPVEERPTKAPFASRQGVLFLGSFLTPGSPNEDAAIHFAKEIFPGIHKELGCGLTVAGTNRLDSISALASDAVAVTGRVDDLTAFFESSRVFVVPHRFAAGIPLKLIEAMSYGLPAVVTPLIASQLGLKDGKEVLVAKSAQEFAAKVVSLYKDEALWGALRRSSFEFIRANHSPGRMKAELERIIRSCLERSGH